MYHNRCSYKRSNDKLGPSLLYILIDLTIVSSIGNRTSTCLMYNSSHDKIIVVLTFAFKCRLVNEITLMQLGMQANQLASTINCAGNITNFTENHAKDTCSLIFVSHKKGVSGKHPIHENNTYYVCFH